MGNGYNIEWSARAVRDLNQILKYLEENWSDKEIRNFIRKLDKRLNLISNFPRLFSEFKVKK